MNAAAPLAGLAEFWTNRTLRGLTLEYGFVRDFAAVNLRTRPVGRVQQT